jgi:hypothetical protein
MSHAAQFGFCFESYGVTISVCVNRPEAVDEIKLRLASLLTGAYHDVDCNSPDHSFYVIFQPDGQHLLFSDLNAPPLGTPRPQVLDFLVTQIRWKIAEFARDRIFIHAGAVSWSGKGIILPANSFRGKTTLVSELVKLGAIYYSDEYAVIDGDGNLHPFAKMLSLRGEIDQYVQVDHPVEDFGGTAGREAVPVSLIFFTQYGGTPSPVILQKGQGILELLKHTFPIEGKAVFALNVLNKLANRAIIAESKRGEALEFAEILVNYIESIT